MNIFFQFQQKIVIVNIPFPATTVVYIYSERIDPEDSVSMPAKKAVDKHGLTFQKQSKHGTGERSRLVYYFLKPILS